MLISTVQQSESAICIYISPLFWISFSFRSPQSPEPGSLSYTVASHSLSILYSAIKRNEVGSFVKTWMEPESAIQSKVSQKEKNENHFLFNTFFSPFWSFYEWMYWYICACILVSFFSHMPIQHRYSTGFYSRLLLLPKHFFLVITYYHHQ